MKKIIYLLFLLLFLGSNVFSFAQYSVSPESINNPKYNYIKKVLNDAKDYNYYEISDLSELNYKLKYNFKVKKTKKINFNNFKIKEISRNNGITNETLYIITNSNDNIIGIEEQILDLKVFDNVLMIVVGGIHQLRVEYIYSLPNTPLFAIGYGIPVTITPNANLKLVSHIFIKCI